METIPQSEVQSVLDAAAAAIGHARAVREEYRGTKRLDRREVLSLAQGRLTKAAAPIRSLRGMGPWHDVPLESELRSVMRELQAERRKLRKMLGRK